MSVSKCVHPGSSYAGGGVKHGSIVQVDDQAQHFKVSLVVSHQVTKVVCVIAVHASTDTWLLEPHDIGNMDA